MHESVIAQELLRTVEEKAAAASAKRVLRVGVRMGGMSGVVPEALAFAFEILRHGTLAEGANLEIEVGAPGSYDLLLTLIEVD